MVFFNTHSTHTKNMLNFFNGDSDSGSPTILFGLPSEGHSVLMIRTAFPSSAAF
ncbi:protein of unknown function [Ruminococcaceae bacterium BL-4]|nr:protein of unknown function [Ruminococcaceae bacterium BL-4]